MAKLDLNNRKELRGLARQERRAFMASKNVPVPQKLDLKIANMLTSLAEHGAEIEDGELKSKLGAALNSHTGVHFVSVQGVTKELDGWLAPMRPAPAEPESEDGEGDEAAE